MWFKRCDKVTNYNFAKYDYWWAGGGADHCYYHFYNFPEYSLPYWL